MSPQPEPVSLCSRARQLDVKRMRLESSAQGMVLVGEPLAVGEVPCDGSALEEPGPGGVLHAVDLDSVSPEVTADTGEDGSFEVALPGAPTDVYRLHLSTPAEKSDFVDITSSAGAVIAVTPCLGRNEQGFPKVPPGKPTVIEARLENKCQEALTITDAALRLGSEGFAIVDDPVGSIAEPLTPVTVRVRFEAKTEGNYEDILLVRFAMGKEARTGILLRATSTTQ